MIEGANLLVEIEGGTWALRKIRPYQRKSLCGRLREIQYGCGFGIHRAALHHGHGAQRRGDLQYP